MIKVKVFTFTTAAVAVSAAPPMRSSHTPLQPLLMASRRKTGQLGDWMGGTLGGVTRCQQEAIGNVNDVSC